MLLDAGETTLLQPAAAVSDGGRIVTAYNRWTFMPYNGRRVWAVATGGAALAGDMNCDGLVTVSGIGGFVLALTDPAAYAAQFPDCDINNADMNQDGTVTVSDIGPFVEVLSGP